MIGIAMNNSFSHRRRQAAALIGAAVFALFGCAMDLESKSMDFDPDPCSCRIVVTTDAFLFETRLLDYQLIKSMRKSPPTEAEWKAIFQVRVHSGPQQPPLPVMQGLYIHEVVSDRVSFRTKYPLAPKVRYEVVLDFQVWKACPKDLSPKKVTYTLEAPAGKTKPAKPPRVTAIYPSADVLPANQLKFYIHFSQPMKQGEAYRHLQLKTSEGRRVEAAFLELGEELWDPDRRRLTLLFDPGRVKRGLVPREEDGPILEEGRSYALEISGNWVGAEGYPLGDPILKFFRVGKEDSEPPDPKTWTIQTPVAGTRDPVIVTFPESLDQALLERVITITDAQGRIQAQAPKIDRNETRAAFTPMEPWKLGEHRLKVGKVLEDLAGNRIGRPFDLDLDRFDQVDREPKTEFVERTFVISDAHEHLEKK